MLSPAGAALLREARDQIVAHPEEFDMAHWDCGTHACIGGWMMRFASRSGAVSRLDMSALCGFGHRDLLGASHPLNPLFYNFQDHECQDVGRAVERINAFLWQYGYPPKAVDAHEPVVSASVVA